MKAIGIDAAALSGWAFRASREPSDRPPNSWQFGTVKATSPQKHDILAFAKEHGVTHVILEQPVPMRGGKNGNHATTQITMGRSMGRWEEACEMAGLIVVPVWVASWQAAMLTTGGRKMDNTNKAASKLIARSLGANVTNGDEADAVCLCAYGPMAVERIAREAEETKLKAKASRRARKESKK